MKLEYYRKLFWEAAYAYHMERDKDSLTRELLSRYGVRDWKEIAELLPKEKEESA